MSTLERICPNCGTANSADRTHCILCNTNQISLADPGQAKLPARFDNPRAVGLVLGVSAVVARVGLNLLTREILPRLAKGLISKPASSVTKQPASDDRPDYIVRGWSAWSVHQNGEHSSGSEQFEWRIKRNK